MNARMPQRLRSLRGQRLKMAIGTPGISFASRQLCACCWLARGREARGNQLAMGSATKVEIEMSSSRNIVGRLTIVGGPPNATVDLAVYPATWGPMISLWNTMPRAQIGSEGGAFELKWQTSEDGPNPAWWAGPVHVVRATPPAGWIARLRPVPIVQFMPGQSGFRWVGDVRAVLEAL